MLLDKETKLKVRDNEVQTLTSDFEIIFIQIEKIIRHGTIERNAM